MDQQTRNRLQNTTQDVRRLLEHEFAEQLEGTYDILPDGKILPESGKHLDDHGRLIRRRLVDSIDHIRVAGKTPAEAVDEHTREAAFTFLNRVVALKMLEGRDLVQQCVSKGDQSSGFREFVGLAPGTAELWDNGYRLYLECLFDELSIEVKVLFDRRDPASLLWPRRQALTQLLDILNHPDLVGVWDQDETIGWVYQYFNSDDDRKEARHGDTGKPRPPQNGYELAVRNQFFTPRYVVEFLTDNTLGRIWYEIRRGDTRLVEQCSYLARRPTELFLKEGERPPEQELDGSRGRDALVRQPAHIPHRAKKDPRDLKIIDPACGSGHFLLYCFDLLLTIYEEAWADEKSPRCETTGQTLREDYATIKTLREAIPELILRHNLHGIDIDSRCAQIAAFAMWMRAQRAFTESGIDRVSRPTIRKTNIVVAEPMPGEKDLLRAFTATLQPPLLGQLVEVIFDNMQLAGEAGSLLKIEEKLREAITQAREQWVRGSKAGQLGLFAEGSPESEDSRFDLSGITDDLFWREAESRTIATLWHFAETCIDGAAFRRTLFAEDAARGFAFIDLCRKQYDVALMNPPFGDASVPSKPYIEETYGDTKGDVYKTFVECFQERLLPAGCLGVISSRTGFFNSSAQDWRERIIFRLFRLLVVADLGYGVLDAKVETAAYVLRNLDEGEDRALTLSLIPGLGRVALDNSGSFSIPKYSTARGGLKRHQALDELGRLLAAGLVQSVPGSFARFRPTEAATSNSDNGSGGVRKCAHASPAVFVRLLRDTDKRSALVEAIGDISAGRPGPRVFVVRIEALRQVPGMPLAYWVSDHIRALFGALPPFEGEGRTVKSGLCTGNDFRFIRSWWEVPAHQILNAQYGPDWRANTPVFQEWCRRCTFEDKRWVSFAKGGEYSPYFAHPQLVVNWHRDGEEIRAGAGSGSLPGARPQNTDSYFAPGLSYTARTSLRLCATPLAAGSVFAHVGPAMFPCAAALEVALARFNSYTAEAFLAPYHARGTEGDDQTKKYEVGLLQRVPWSSDVSRAEGEAAELVVAMLQRQATSNETGRTFYAPRFGPDPTCSIVDAVLRVERAVAEAYELTLEDSFETACSTAPTTENILADVKNGVRVGLGWPDRVQQAHAILSYCLGCVFGRWDIRLAFDGRTAPPPVDPFDPLPVGPAGLLVDRDGQPLDPPPDYPVWRAADGILVDDRGHVADVMQGVQSAYCLIQGERGERAIREIAAVIDPARSVDGDLRQWFRALFFDYHRKRYSKSGRRAPVYWQLATPSSSYSVWLYYHRFTPDMFYNVLNDYVKPKLVHEQRKLDRLRVEAGPEPTRSQRTEVDQQNAFVAELKTFAEEIERIAPLWKPDLNDGVIINFSPLWRLVPQHKPWQKECKACWDKLVKGDYDWAHLAMHLWPERVVPRCHTDRSLAIAHDLENQLWETYEDDRGKKKWRPKDVDQAGIDRLVADRTNFAVKAALESLLDASATSSGKRRGRRKTFASRS